MAHYDGMREATEAGNESQRQAQITVPYSTPREAMVSICNKGRHETGAEVVKWLDNLQLRGGELNADDCYTLASAVAIIKRLTKELEDLEPVIRRSP